MSDGVIFLTPPLQEDMEITGPIAVKLFVSSSTADVDIFVVLRAFHPDLKELIFSGQTDPHTPIAQGWLRASRRKLDPALSLPYRPYHVHDEDQKLVPGEVYELDIEVLPTCVVLPTGYRIGLDDPRPRLRLWRRPRPRHWVPGGVHRRRRFPSRRGARPAGGDLQRRRHAALRRGSRRACDASCHSAEMNHSSPEKVRRATDEK